MINIWGLINIFTSKETYWLKFRVLFIYSWPFFHLGVLFFFDQKKKKKITFYLLINIYGLINIFTSKYIFFGENALTPLEF